MNNPGEQYYTLEDLYSIPKIDAHIHYHAESSLFAEQAKKLNFQLLAINTEAPMFPELPTQLELARKQQEQFTTNFHYLTTISMDQCMEEGWSEKQIQKVQQDMKEGARGVKVWKNIGMTIKKPDSTFLMLDDPLFDELFEYFEKNKIPVLGHLGEPKNCWLPLAEMTINSDREYFSKHPEYHMHLHPEYPSYSEQIAARNRRLDKHPDLIFIGAHLASLEWDVDSIAAWLDKYPNSLVDVAERVCHLELQAGVDREKVRNFILKYSNRIIYGSDIIFDNAMTNTFFVGHIKNIYENDWKFFTSEEIMKVPRVKTEFQGLRLPKKIMDQIYYENALICYKQN